MNASSWISAGLVKSSLRRFWPLWALYLLAWLMLFVAPLYTTATSAVTFADGPDDIADAVEGVWTFTRAVMLPFIATGAAVIAISLNDHLFDARAATFTGALPLRRRTVFASVYIAGLAAQAGVLALTCLAIAGVSLALPALGGAFIAQWAALAFALTFVFYSLATLVCQLTGTRTVAVVLYAVANGLVACIETAIRLAVSAFQYGFGFRGIAFDWASPFIGIMHYGLFGGGGPAGGVDWAVIAAYCAAAIAFTALACTLHSRRNLEMAGEAVAWPALRPVLKYLAGVSGALLLAAFAVLLFWTGGSFGTAVGAGRAVTLALLMAFGAAASLTFAEMVMSRSTHVLGKCWKGAGVFALAAVAFSGVICTDVLGIAARIPEAGEVEAVEVTVDGSRAAELDSDEGIEQTRQLHADILDYGGAHAADGTGRMMENAATIDLTYTLANGGTLHRSYPVQYTSEVGPDDRGRISKDGGGEIVTEMLALVNGPEGRASRYEKVFGEGAPAYTVQIGYAYSEEDGPSTTTLSGKEAGDFLQAALKPDMLEHSVGDFWMLGSEEETYDVLVRVIGPDGNDALSVWLGEESTPNSVAWIREHLPTVALTVDG